MLEEVADSRSSWRVERGVGGEVGASVGAAEEARGLVVGSSCLLGGLEGPQPHPDLLSGVFDLCHPSARWSLPHTNKHVTVVRGLCPALALHLQWLGSWSLIVLLLEMELHFF